MGATGAAGRLGVLLSFWCFFFFVCFFCFCLMIGWGGVGWGGVGWGGMLTFMFMLR